MIIKRIPVIRLSSIVTINESNIINISDQLFDLKSLRHLADGEQLI